MHDPMEGALYGNGEHGSLPHKKTATLPPKQSQPQPGSQVREGRLCTSERVSTTDIPTKILLDVYLKAADGVSDIMNPYQLDITSVKSSDRIRPSFALIEEDCRRTLLAHGHGASFEPLTWQFKINASVIETNTYEIPMIAWNINAAASDIRSVRFEEEYSEKLAKYKERVHDDFYDRCLIRAQECKQAILKPLLSNDKQCWQQTHGDRQCRSVGCSRALVGIEVEDATVRAELVLILPCRVEHQLAGRKGCGRKR